MSKKGIMIGLLAAAAAGAVAGILLAPNKGSKTRKKLFKKGRKTVDGIKNSYNDLKDTVTEKFHSAADDISDKIKKTTSSNSVVN